jgi:hypothetical protein
MGIIGQSVWTENQAEGRAHLDDGLVGLDKLDDSEDRITNRGVVWIGDCGRCGWQLKATIPWGEVLAFHMRQTIVPNTKIEQWGFLFGLKCRNTTCGKTNGVRLTWQEIANYINHGIQAGILNPRLFAPGPPPPQQR